jgi:hypothetical protein
MKKLILAIFLCYTIILNANMASPINRGTLGANPFLNNYVTITTENLYIKIDESFKYAEFDIEYIINAEKDGINIPLLFYASEYYGNFKVSIDDKPISLKEYHIENTKLTNFEYLYSTNNANTFIVNNTFNNGESEPIRLEDFLYFETNISKGKHSIKVSYKASTWNYKHRRLNESSFRYALSPAKQWKSFGTLNITVDASLCNEVISTNLGNPQEGKINTISTYHFNKLPTDIIIINLEPKLSTFVKLLLKINYFNLALLLMLPLVFIHYKLIKKYRLYSLNTKLSAIAIIGGLLLPILFIFVMILSSFLIDYFLGDYASGREGYGVFYSFMLLPKFVLIYLTLSLITDFITKHVYLNQKK